jgi:uncharacterized protein (DUF2062 family)
MPRRVFKSLSRQRHRWNARWFMRPFRLLLEQPVYWSLNRRNVTRAFALGLAIAFVPIPVHFLLATILALGFRLNVPAAIFGTFLANPLTMVPMYMGAYWIGSHLLGITTHPIAFSMTWDWLTTQLLPIWKPFLLGCLVLGLSAAIVGYAILGGIWHLSLVLKYHERKGANSLKDSAKAEK